MMKKYKWFLILPVVLIFIFITLYCFKTFIYYNDKTVYGDRLSGIEEVIIQEDFKNDIINSLKIYDEVAEASLNVRGKIINILIKLNDKITSIKGKNILNDILIKFDDAQKDFYDIQIFIVWDLESTDNQSIIGYKNRNSDIIIWDGN